MHCFICVTYLMIIATAHPPRNREVTKTHEKRSIFNDVIQSLRIRAQLPKEIDLSDENNIGQNYDKFVFDNDPLQLPSDIDFMPRRNDRIEMPTLKYRLPKMLMNNESFEDTKGAKAEIVLYVNTPTEYDDNKMTTPKPKKTKRPRPNTNKIKSSIKNKEDTYNDAEMETSDKPFMTSMTGQSQIGNRDSQTVVKPTVIVNFRGSVMHRESDIRLESKKSKNDTRVPQNIFNINQEIKVERNDAEIGSSGNLKRVPAKLNQDVNIVPDKEKSRIDEDMMMCETSAWKDKEEKERSSRKHDVLQILVSV